MLLELNTRPAINLMNIFTIETSIISIILIYVNLTLQIKSCESLTRLLASVDIPVDLSTLPKLNEGDLSDEYELDISKIPFISIPFAIEATIRVHRYIKIYVDLLQAPYRRFLNKLIEPQDVKVVLELLIFSMNYNSSMEDIKLFVDNNKRYINRSMIYSLHPNHNRHILDQINHNETRVIRQRHRYLRNYYESLNEERSHSRERRYKSSSKN